MFDLLLVLTFAVHCSPRILTENLFGPQSRRVDLLQSRKADFFQSMRDHLRKFEELRKKAEANPGRSSSRDVIKACLEMEELLKKTLKGFDEPVIK